jgi:predicted Zn-dependent peptidase
MYRLDRLAKGLTVASAAMPHMASVSLGFWVGTGGRYESAPMTGAAHFIEHLLFKGTRRRTARQISQDVEGLGGYLNAFTSEENTCFFAKASQGHLADLFDVLSDMFLHSRFDPDEINKERDVIKEEIAQYRDQPAHYVQELLNATQWPRQPLGRSITGTERSLDRLDRAQLVAHFKSHYLASNTLIVMAGGADHSRLMRLARRIAPHVPAGPRPTFAPAFNRQVKPALRLATRDTEQTQLALSVRTCSRHDDRRYALRLLNTLLGENMSSRLFQVLREERGLAYSVNSSLSFFDDVGDLVVSAGLDVDHLARALRLILDEWRRLAQTPPPLAELHRARDYVIGQSDLSLEGTENHMMWLGEHLLAYGTITPPDVIKDRIRRVTPAQITAVARDFFQPDRLTLALVSPLESARHLERHLRC